MTNERKKSIIDMAMKTYGKDLQLNQVNEELAELIVEVAKSRRGFNNRRFVLEEMGDVLICLDYLKTIFEITDEEIRDVVEFKLERTLKRINEGYDPKEVEYV